jgi:hypothetical protein
MRRVQFLRCVAILGCSWSAAQQYEYPFLNPNLSVDERAANILSLMTLEEKIAALTSPAVGYGTSEGIHQVVLNAGRGGWKIRAHDRGYAQWSHRSNAAEYQQRTHARSPAADPYRTDHLSQRVH